MQFLTMLSYSIPKFVLTKIAEHVIKFGMMKRQFIGIVLLLMVFQGGFTLNSKAQRPHDKNDLKKLQQYEKRLQAIGDSMKDAGSQAMRVHSLKKFIPKFVEALKVPGSFDYSFDSLNYVFTFTPADRSFRLYNWHIDFVNQNHRFYGAIQKNNEDSLELIPLYDRVEDALPNVEDTVVGQEGWYGAQYYKLIQKTIDDRKHYFLLGWDGFNAKSNRKLIDVLTFDQKGNPHFGAPVFKVDGKLKKRLLFIFSDNATMQMNYNAEEEMIIYDNLVPPNEKSKGRKFTYIPDGTYSYLRFNAEQGLWIKKNNLYKEDATKPKEDADPD